MELRRSPETEALFKILGAMKPDESMSFEELDLRVGFDTRSTKWRLWYVRDQLKRSGQAVIDQVGQWGLRRLKDAEVIHEHSDRYKRRLRSAAGRGSRALTSVDYDALLEQDKTAHNAHQSAFGAIRLFTKLAAHKVLSAVADEAKAVLPAKTVLRLFGGK